MGNEIFDWGRAIIIGGRWHKNLVGTISEGYKSRGAPMVNIKDFILASKNLGGGGTCPQFLHTSRSWPLCRKFRVPIKPCVLSKIPIHFQFNWVALFWYLWRSTYEFLCIYYFNHTIDNVSTLSIVWMYD